MTSKSNILAIETRMGASTASIVDLVVALSAKSQDGLIAYVDLWNALYPETPWRGHGALHTIGKIMGRATAHCVDHCMPILTTLIVQKSTRRMSEFAMKNVFAACKERGMKTDHVNAVAFCFQQQRETIRCAMAHR